MNVYSTIQKNTANTEGKIVLAVESGCTKKLIQKM